MISLFRAHLELRHIHEITPQLLHAHGIKYVISDLDNTIADYDTLEPNDEMCGWVQSLKDADIGFAIVSNNCKARVAKFCETLSVPYYWRSGKPLSFQIWRAMRTLHAKRKETCLIGDKYLTDVLGARLAGLFCIHVPSIKPRKRRVKK